MFQVKTYNKALRAHTLTVPALCKIMMPELLSYTERADPECHAQLVELADKDDTEHVLDAVELIKTYS